MISRIPELQTWIVAAINRFQSTYKYREIMEK
jgi:hypothetical protein